MAYLFDTDAISELLRKKPSRRYVNWLKRIPREEQFTSAIVIGELFKGAFRSSAVERHLGNIELRILPVVTVLPFDVPVARIYGKIRAHLERSGEPIGDADIQIAATAVHHDLAIVSGNLRHHSRVPGLKIEKILDRARA